MQNVLEIDKSVNAKYYIITDIEGNVHYHEGWERLSDDVTALLWNEFPEYALSYYDYSTACEALERIRIYSAGKGKYVIIKAFQESLKNLHHRLGNMI